MAQIQPPGRINLDAPMQRPHPDGTRPARVGVVPKLQPRPPEPPLRLEDGAVAQRHRDGLVGRRVLEPRLPGPGGELDDVAPLEALALDVARVEGRAGRVVQVRGRQRRRHAPVKDDGASDRARWVGGAGREGRCCCCCCCCC